MNDRTRYRTTGARPPIWALLFGASLLLMHATASPLTAQEPAIGVVRPDGGDRCVAGTAYTIRWQARSVGGDVRISLWDGTRDVWSVVAASIPAAAGEFRWIVPTTLHGRMFRIRVESIGAPAYAMSRSYFFIEPAVPASAGTVAASATEHAVSIVPNPAADVAVIRTDGTPQSLVLTDLRGVRIRAYAPSLSTDGAYAIPIADLPSGNYIVTIEFTDESRRSETMVIRR